MTPFDMPRRQAALLRSVRTEGTRLIRRHTAADRSRDYAAAETLVRKGLASWDDQPPTDFGYRRLRAVEERPEDSRIAELARELAAMVGGAEHVTEDEAAEWASAAGVSGDEVWDAVLRLARQEVAS